MQSYSFIPNDSYFNEAQALYIGLFDAPQSSLSGGLQYWEGQLALNQTGALNAISNYATYNGQPLSSSNITGEIVNIYHNLLGITVSSSNAGVQYWASQWNGNGGSQSIGQITADIYNAVENSNLSVSEVMNDKIMNYYNEAQSLYIGLLNVPATANGLTYWEGQLAANQAGALNSISTYAGLDGLLSNGAAPLTASNIGSEINDIYEHLFGLPVTSAAETYWASQWTGDGGTQSIGQITADIYNIVETLPSTNPYYEALNNVISEANTSLSLSNTLADINYNSNPQSFTMPTSFQVPVTNGYYDSNGNYIATSYQYSYIFPASTTQSDTLVLPASSNNLTITDVNNNTYYGAMTYAFTGDSSGHNTVDVSYQTSGGSGLTNYLADAANFQTLDFNYNGTNNNYNSVNLNISQINPGFTNFIMDNTGFANDFTFNNATNNDTFIVQANLYSLTVNDAANNNVANIIMDGANISDTGIDFFGSTINIDSAGNTANAIKGGIDFTNSAITSMTLNITGSQNLSVVGDSINFSYYGTGLNDGSTLNINDNSTGSLAFNFFDNSSSSSLGGVTINASHASAPLAIGDVSSDNAPNSIILGSGADSVSTDNGNSTITVGSGADTIVSYADISNIIYNSSNVPVDYSGYIANISGSINSNDSVIFTYNIPSSVSIIGADFTQYNESSASTVNQAIAMALNALNNYTGYNNTDNAAWFQYEGNTYIVNAYGSSGFFGQLSDQAVKLTGTVDLSNVTISGHTISNL